MCVSEGGRGRALTEASGHLHPRRRRQRRVPAAGGSHPGVLCRRHGAGRSAERTGQHKRRQRHQRWCNVGVGTPGELTFWAPRASTGSPSSRSSSTRPKSPALRKKAHRHTQRDKLTWQLVEDLGPHTDDTKGERTLVGGLVELGVLGVAGARGKTTHRRQPRERLQSVDQRVSIRVRLRPREFNQKGKGTKREEILRLGGHQDQQHTQTQSKLDGWQNDRLTK